MTHVLKRIVAVFLLKRTDELSPSAAASSVAASRLNSRIARKTKVSETETRPFTLGIWIVILAPTITVIAVRRRKRRSISDTWRREIETRQISRPRAMIDHW